MDNATIAISRGNSKMGWIPNISLPPIQTCPKGIPCAEKCYALKAYKQYPSVKAAWDRNLAIFRNDGADYFGQLDAFLARKAPAYFRFHVAGDIVSDAYFAGMLDIATRHPASRFLAYTKTDYHRFAMPKNLVLLHSTWLDDEPIADAKNFSVYFSLKQLRAAKAKPCSGDCRACKLCYLADKPINIGIVLH